MWNRHTSWNEVEKKPQNWTAAIGLATIEVTYRPSVCWKKKDLPYFVRKSWFKSHVFMIHMNDICCFMSIMRNLLKMFTSKIWPFIKNPLCTDSIILDHHNIHLSKPSLKLWLPIGSFYQILFCRKYMEQCKDSHA